MNYLTKTNTFFSVNEYPAEVRKMFVSHRASKRQKENTSLVHDISKMFHQADFGVIVLKNGRIVDCNSTLLNMLEYGQPELIGMHFSDLLVGNNFSAYQSLFGKNQSDRKQSQLRIRYVKPDRTVFWSHTMVAPLNDSEDGYQLVIIQDAEEKITNEMQQEHAISLLKSQVSQLTDFAMSISHDLKSPLRAVTNLISWLKEDEETKLSENSMEYLKEVDARLNRMYSLIEGVLDYSRSENKQSKKVIDSRAFIDKVVHFVNKPESFTINFEGNFPCLYMCEFKLQQLVQNLIVNAIEYNDKANCNLHIEAFEDLNYFYFTFTDNGIGIPKEKFAKIFQLFTSVGSQSKGTGIGLSIVQKICEQYGGQIQIHSEVGIGSSFTISLAKKEAAFDQYFKTTQNQSPIAE